MHNLSAIVGNTKVGHSLVETPGRGLLQVRLSLKKFSLLQYYLIANGLGNCLFVFRKKKEKALFSWHFSIYLMLCELYTT